LRPSSLSGRFAFWWCRACTVLLPRNRASRTREERLAHLLDAEAAAVPGARLVVGALLGTPDDLRCTLQIRARLSERWLADHLDSRETAVLVASALVAVAYIASLAARYPLPHAVKTVAQTSAALSLLSVVPAGYLRRRGSTSVLDTDPLSSYNRGWAGAVLAEGGSAVTHIRRSYTVLGAALVLSFLLSAVGSGSTRHDGLYWVGAIAWAAFGLVALAILALTIAVGVRAVRRQAAS